MPASICKWTNLTDPQKLPQECQTRQIYLWIITKDRKVIIVSKDKKDWQWPGGKPKENETIHETIEREILEETGLNIAKQTSDIKMFGFYKITQNQNDKKIDFLQLRFWLQLNADSRQLNLKPVENPTDSDPIKWVKVVGLREITITNPALTDQDLFRLDN